MSEELELTVEEVMNIYLDARLSEYIKKKTLDKLSMIDKAVLYRELKREKDFKATTRKPNLDYLIDRELSWNNSEKPLGV
jgi:RecB family exonuclease